MKHKVLLHVPLFRSGTNPLRVGGEGGFDLTVLTHGMHCFEEMFCTVRGIYWRLSELDLIRIMETISNNKGSQHLRINTELVDDWANGFAPHIDASHGVNNSSTKLMFKWLENDLSPAACSVGCCFIMMASPKTRAIFLTWCSLICVRKLNFAKSRSIYFQAGWGFKSRGRLRKEPRDGDVPMFRIRV